MSIFNRPGLWARNPGGEVQNAMAMRAAGFEWLAINVHDFTPTQWQKEIQSARAAGMTVLPWGRINALSKKMDLSLEESAAWLSDLARNDFDGKVIYNAEKELDGNDSLRKKIEVESKGLDAALSPEPRLYDSLAHTELVKRLAIQLQIFPQENNTSKDPRWCKAWAHEIDAVRVHFMIGMHHLTPAAFPPLRTPYSIYTANDCGGNFSPWRPANPAPLNVPFKWALYPVGHPKYAATPKLPWTVRALKVAMHRMGFGNFYQDVPDPSYGPLLQKALKLFQLSVGIKPAYGWYGRGTSVALATALTSVVGTVSPYALGPRELNWMTLPGK